MADNFALAAFVVLPLVCGGLLLGFARRVSARRRIGLPESHHGSRSARNVRRIGAADNWARLLLGNCLVLLLLLSLVLLGGEIYCRFFCDTTDSLLYTKICRRWFQRHWHENSVGFRDNVDYGLKIGPGRRRITFVGDSFTAGQGVKDVEDRFVNRIRKAHPNWEVHMLAKPAADTDDEGIMLSEPLGLGYQLDQVVLVYCLNDIGDMMPESTEAAQRILAEAREGGGWLMRHSYFLNFLRYRLNVLRDPHLRDYFPFVREAYRGPLWGRQKERLKAFRDLVHGHGGQLAVVTFPFLHALGSEYPYQFVHDELDQLWRELKVPHLDLLKIYKDLPPKTVTVNSFDAHPNERAHALAAEAIAQFLKARMAGNVSSPDGG